MSCLEEHALQSWAQQEQGYFIKYIGSFVIIQDIFYENIQTASRVNITVYCLRQENKLEGLGEERQSEWGKNKRNREVIVQILNQGHFPMEVLFNQLMQLPLICTFFCSLSTHRYAFSLLWPPHREVKSIKNPYSSSPLSDLQLDSHILSKRKPCNPMKNTSRVKKYGSASPVCM